MFNAGLPTGRRERRCENEGPQKTAACRSRRRRPEEDRHRRRQRTQERKDGPVTSTRYRPHVTAGRRHPDAVVGDIWAGSARSDATAATICVHWGSEAVAEISERRDADGALDLRQQ